jgi:membrane-associated phospholipid phosphatase
VAGKALVRAIRLVPERRRRMAEWLLIGAAAGVAIAGDLLSNGPGAAGAFAFVIAALPGTVAYLAWRTVFASAVVSLLPVYFFIGWGMSGRTLHMPATALDRAVALEPAWMFVYGSMYVFVLLPLLVVRDQPLFRRALQSYLMVLLVAYAGFVLYPTLTPRPAVVLEQGFAAWALRLNYALDTRYNCFPCLHVAHSFVSALACYRVHKRVGLAAALWAALIGASTLFTKQHYAVDVVAGAAVGLAAYVAFLRPYPREAVPEPDRRRAPIRALVAVGVYAIVVAGFWVIYQTGMIA